MTASDVFSKKGTKVSAYEPWISDDDKKLVLQSLNQTMLTLGPNLEKFEKMFAKYTKTKDAVAVSNCTAALHLSLMALGIKKGDEVIIPDLTFIADANAVLAVGARPVMADIDDNFAISARSVKKKLSKNTKAIIPVHIYGESCNMDEILDIAKSNDIKVVEDCAHAVGTFYKRKHVGGFGDTGCFSFYPTKNLTTAEGGMVTTNFPEIAEKVRQLRSHGMTRSLSDRYKRGYPWVFDVKEPGYNYRLDEIRCALGISQLSRISKINELRKNAAKYYNKMLKNVRGIISPKIVNDGSHSYHLYTIRVTKSYGKTRNQLFEFLRDNGIRTTVYWLPIHKFTAYKKFIKNPDDVKNSARIYEEILALPLYPTISRKQQDVVIDHIKQFQKK
jgi:dTDP-4-amino-4,6-dideoxygalactose transaminase